MKMNKRTLLSTLCLTLSFSHFAQADETIKVWSWDIAADALKKLTPAFEQQHPGVKVEVIDMGPQQIYDQALAGCSAGGINLPDVLTLENQAAERYWHSFPNCFATLNEFGIEEYRDQFASFKWSELQKGDNIYAMPWDSGPVVLFYRRDMYEKAGIKADDIKTWDDYIAAGKKMKSAYNGRVKMALTNHASGDNWFSMMAGQNGCSYFKNEGSEVQVTINQPGCVDALNTLSKMVQNDLLGNGDWDGKLQGLRANKAATAMYGGWFEGSIRDFMPEQSGKWGVQLMPASKPGGVRASNNGGSALAIPNNSKHKKLAYEFMTFALTNKDNQIDMLKGGLIPSYLPATKDSYVHSDQPYWGGQKVWELMLNTLDDIPVVASTPYSVEAKDIYIFTQGKVLSGEYPDAQKALDKAAEQISKATGLKIAK